MAAPTAFACCLHFCYCYCTLEVAAAAATTTTIVVTLFAIEVIFVIVDSGPVA